MRPLRVYITIDTEFWPSAPDFHTGVRHEDLVPEREVRRDVFGVTPRGEFGIGRQLDLFREHGLEATFFVESLCASVVGFGPLEQVVRPIVAAGQDVQLHIHTEWLKVTPNTILPNRTGQHIRSFTLEEQQLLLALARDNLEAAGAPRINSFRAGNFGANWDTLRALAAIGLTFDSSYNPGHLGRACDMPGPALLHQPAAVHGMWEVPVSTFEELPGRFRHAQIGAASIGEMRHALLEAHRLGWEHFVILTHSNEFLNARRDGPNRIALARLEWLCRFLGENRDRFPTATFGGLDPKEMAGASPNGTRPIRSNAVRTAIRMGEQLAQRWY